MRQTDTGDFAHQLRRLRRRSGLTQEELAGHAGISPAAVSLLERGITQAPQRATLDLLCAALTLSPAEAAALRAAARPAAQDEAPAVAETPALTQLPATAGDLPVPLTPLFGREREVEALARLLARDDARLVTLTGPAGVGKTRLALRLAAMLRAERGRDVVFVGLIPVQDPERVLPAIAQALEIRESGTMPLRDSLIQALRARDLVLVLDNFEQVLPAARAVLELLIACPKLHALVTSRGALNVRGERCFPVAPLALPDPLLPATLDELARVPTIALFIDRASVTDPDFALTSLEDAHLVAAICARLDALPLAIELAAARVRHFGLRQLHDRVTEPAFLGLLAEGPRDLADHQRTMRSTIAWSYDLLSPDEQRLFRALGVFVGGASLGALESVAGMVDVALSAGLDSLLNANLLQCTAVYARPRYTQLVTVRAYAQECLRATGEWEQTCQRYAEYFQGLTRLLDHPNVDLPSGLLEQLDVEQDNVRAALRWALENGFSNFGLHMVAYMWRYWDPRAYFLEGLDWYERIVARAGTPESPEDQTALAQAWTGIMVMCHRMDRFARAREAGEAALELRRRLGDPKDIAASLSNLGNPVTSLHDYKRALALYEESLAILREHDLRSEMPFPLLNVGGLYYEMGQPREALAYYEQSIAMSRELGESELARGLTWTNVGEALIVLDEPTRAIAVVVPVYELFDSVHANYGIAVCDLTLARAEWRLGDLAAAVAHLDEAERLLRAMGTLSSAARALYLRASVALLRGDTAAARDDLAQALQDLSGQPRQHEDIWWVVERAGTVACQLDCPEQAARLYAAAIAHRDAVPGPLDPAERELREGDLERLRAALGAQGFAAATEAGRSMGMDEATRLLREVLRTEA